MTEDGHVLARDTRSSTTMRHQQNPLGTCPECGESILPGDVLIEYQTAEGEDRYAECPSCETVVHPD